MPWSTRFLTASMIAGAVFRSMSATQRGITSLPPYVSNFNAPEEVRGDVDSDIMIQRLSWYCCTPDGRSATEQAKVFPTAVQGAAGVHCCMCRSYKGSGTRGNP